MLFLLQAWALTTGVLALVFAVVVFVQSTSPVLSKAYRRLSSSRQSALVGRAVPVLTG